MIDDTIKKRLGAARADYRKAFLNRDRDGVRSAQERIDFWLAEERETKLSPKVEEWLEDDDLDCDPLDYDPLDLIPNGRGEYGKT